jgi:hypothetical protein
MRLGGRFPVFSVESFDKIIDYEGNPMPRNPNKTPCSVPGCRAWAIRGSDPPRCSPHRHATVRPGPALRCPPSPSRGPAEGPARSASPEAVLEGPGRGVGAPPGNQNRLVHGFYANVLHPEELADLAVYAADATVDAEIAIVRVALRRILGMLLTGMTAGPNPSPLDAQDYARFASLAFRGAGTVSRLFRARQALGGDKQDAITSAVHQALDELSAEWDVEL